MSETFSLEAFPLSEVLLREDSPDHIKLGYYKLGGHSRKRQDFVYEK